jgi:heme-degrading monooxygenase HmoA
VIAVIFRNRVVPGAAVAEEYEKLSARMRELAEAMPGFLGIKSYVADDGENVSISRFESEAALSAWREHPEHREAQRIGRERIYAMYAIEVTSVIRSGGFDSALSSESPE